VTSGLAGSGGCSRRAFFVQAANGPVSAEQEARMNRFTVVAVLLLAAGGCAGEDSLAGEAQAVGSTISLRREHVVGDIYHHELVVAIGQGPNARLRLHRVVRESAPWVPRPTAGGAMLLHGDFSTFVTSFAPTLGDPASPAPGLAPYLAAQGLDVWGADRRWTLAEEDTSDFAGMTAAQELDDLREALALARATRAATGQGGDRLALVGFSHGAQLAYAYAAVEGARPPAQRHVDALVPLDFYASFAPEDEALRAETCEYAAFERELVAGGSVDAPNDFLIEAGRLARTAPEEPSPRFPGATNRGAMLTIVGQTYLFAPFAPAYHLAAPILDGEAAIGLAESPEPAIAAWLEGATPHQAMAEAADLDALLCGEAPLPVAAPLSNIRVPLLYLGAAGGIGSLGLHSTTQVASADVTRLVVQRFGADRRAEDFGHADLLFANDAPALAWQPLAAWLLHH
jgi:hypothetical protein